MALIIKNRPKKDMGNTMHSGHSLRRTSHRFLGIVTDPRSETSARKTSHHFPGIVIDFCRECPLWHSGGSPLSTPWERPGKAFDQGRSHGSHPPAVPDFITGRNPAAGVPSATSRHFPIFVTGPISIARTANNPPFPIIVTI